jgi:hypothetical protein
MFAIERLLRAGASWSDLREFAGGTGLFVLMVAVVLLAIMGLVYVLWAEVAKRERKGAVEGQPSPIRLRHVVEVAMLSAFLGILAAAATASGRSSLGAPGWWVAGVLGNLTRSPETGESLGVIIVSAVVVDASICFALLWGGYLLWRRARSKGTQGSAQ